MGTLGRARQVLGLKQGIDQETGKKIIKDIKAEGYKKAQVQIQGDELQVTAPSRDTLPEITHNGEVLHSVEATGAKKTIEAKLEISVESSGWIAVRVLGPTQHGAMDSYLFAHTNPVYVIADAEPIRSTEDAAFFVRWIDEVIEELRGMDRWDDPRHKEEVIATFEEGRRLYQEQVER